MLVDARNGLFTVTQLSPGEPRAVRESDVSGRWNGSVFCVPATWPNTKRLSRFDAPWTPAARDLAAAAHAVAASRSRAARASDADVRRRADSEFELTPMQRAGAAWLADSPGAMLCDEMGSGKTVQVCEALSLSGARTVLVVCPKAVLSVWASHIERMLGGPPVFVLHGPARSRSRTFDAFARQLTGVRIALVPWSTLRMMSMLAPWSTYARIDGDDEPKQLNSLAFDVAVFDEAHRAKDPGAKQTRAAWSIDAEKKWALTGTPVANKPDDMWSLLRLIDPPSWSSRGKFIRKYCNTASNNWAATLVTGWRREMLPELAQLTAPVYLRRSMQTVTGLRIERVREVRETDLPAAHRKLYDTVRDEWRLVMESAESWVDSALAATVRLHQAAAAPLDMLDDGMIAMRPPSPKVTELLSLLGDLPDGEPVVVFSVSRQLVDLARSSLERKRVAVGCLVGGMRPADIEATIKAWERGDTQVLLCTYGVGSEGITLAHSRIVVHLHASWSLVQRMQAEDRVRRPGQESSSVLIVDIVAKDTIDEQVHRALDGKKSFLQDISPKDLL